MIAKYMDWRVQHIDRQSLLICFYGLWLALSSLCALDKHNIVPPTGAENKELFQLEFILLIHMQTFIPKKNR